MVIYALWRGLLYFTRYFTASVYPQIPGTGRTAKKSKRSSFSIHSNILEQSPEGHTSHPVRSARSSLRSLFCGQKTTHTPAKPDRLRIDGTLVVGCLAGQRRTVVSYRTVYPGPCSPGMLLAFEWLLAGRRWALKRTEGTSQP